MSVLLAPGGRAAPLAAAPPVTEVGSVAAMQNLGAGSAAVGSVSVTGYNQGGTTGGGVFVYTSASIPQDGCVNFTPVAGGGTWVRQTSGATSMRTSYCGSLAQADAYATMNAQTLIIDQSFTFSGPVVLSSPVVAIVAGVQLTHGANGLAFRGMLSAPPTQIFDGAATGIVRFSVAQPAPLYAEWFGAINDGKTDSTNAINNMINASWNGAGTYQHIPMQFARCGLYRTTAPLLLSSTTTNSFTVRGAGGNNCTAIYADFVKGDVWDITGFQIEFDGVSALASPARTKGGGSGWGFYSVLPGHASTVGPTILKDLSVYGQPSGGIQLVDPELSELDNLDIDNNGGPGIYLYGQYHGGTNNKISQVRTKQNATQGLIIYGVTNVMVDGFEGLDNNIGNTACDVRVLGPSNTAVTDIFVNPDIEQSNPVNSISGICFESGISHQVQGGNYFQLGGAPISLSNVSGVTISPFRTLGVPAHHMAMQVLFGPGAVGNIVSLTGNQTFTDADFSGALQAAANTVVINGQVQRLPYYPPFPGASYAPNLSNGTFHQFTQGSSNPMSANTQLTAPTNGFGATSFEIEYQEDATVGSYTLTLDPSAYNCPPIAGTPGVNKHIFVFAQKNANDGNWVCTNTPTWF